MHLKKNQKFYLVRIPEIDDGTQFYVVKKNFKVDQAAPIPFKSERPTTTTLPPGRPTGAPAISIERDSTCNVVNNIEGHMSHNLSSEEIKELWQQGIEVDDDNEPAPENVPTRTEAPPPVSGTWERPTHCPRCAKNFQDLAGKFTNHRWDQIAEYDKF